MDIIVMIAQVLTGLTILVFIHELGHFLAAKMFKTKVEKFYLFFDFLFPMPHILNFALWKKKIGDTEYGFGWFPLGGYVSIAGMVDETQDETSLASEPQPWEYRSKAGWQKLIIILGGIIFNLIFAALIYTCLMKFDEKFYVPASTLKPGDITVTKSGEKYGFKSGDVIKSIDGETPKRIEDMFPMHLIVDGGKFKVERQENGIKSEKEIVLPKNLFDSLKGPMFYPSYQILSVKKISSGSNAEKAGLLKGDVIKMITDNRIQTREEISKTIVSFDVFKTILDSNKNKELDFTILRNNQEKNIKIKVDDKGTIGFFPKITYDKTKYQTQNYTLFESFSYGAQKCMSIFSLMYTNIKKIFTGEIKAKDSVGGPIAMAKGFGSNWDWIHFWEFTAMISVCLAFMNLLPIPALDGGHAVVIIIEMIIRRPLPLKVQVMLQNIGTYLLLALMLFAVYNDITRK